MNSSTVASDGYHQPYVKTGYEYIVPNRTGEMFAYTAKQDGKVLTKNDKGIVIEYNDKSRKGIEIGRVYGNSEGTTYPHDIVSPLKKDDTFIKGDVIAYNSGFFEQDFLDTKRIVLKTSKVAKTVLYESNQTNEDSSSISKELASSTTSKTTKVKSITVEFKQHVELMLKEKDYVYPDMPILLLEDTISSNLTMFNKEDLLKLRKLAGNVIKSKYEGTIDKIEVFYNGLKEDMSPSLLELVETSDKNINRRYNSIKTTNKDKVMTGRVNDDYKVSGVSLGLDKAEIKIYITITTNTGSGDKLIYANQMKSVIGEVMQHNMHTKSGEKIDVVFGARSIYSRIVLSPMIIGTTTTLLKIIGKNAVKIYRG